MGEAFLDYKKGGSGLNINGIIEDYYVYAGEKVSAGDFVEFVNGIAGNTTETSEDTAILDVIYRSYSFSACKLSEDKVFIAHSTYNNTSKSNYLYGIVCTISGATITVGADTLLSSEERAGDKSSVVALSETSVFIAHNGTSSYCLYGMVCSISGTAIKVEKTKKMNTTTNTGGYISAKLMQNGNIFVAHSYNSNSYLYGMIVVVNGTTITNGSSTQLNAGMYSAYEMSLLEYDNEMAIIHTGNSSYYLYMTLCLVDGFTITLETTTQIGKEQYSGACISAQKLENGNIFVAHSYSSSYYLYGLVIDVSNGLSIGTDTELLTLNKSAGESAGNPSVATILLSNNRILISCNASTLYGMIANISGTTITIGENVILDSNSDSGNHVKVILPMESDNVLIIHREGSSYYLHAQVFGIDEANNIPTTSVSIPSYETQVRPATTLPCNGVASTSGEGGDSSGHKDIVSVYTVEQTLASLPVGTLVKDTSSTFLGEPVIWKIADVNHEGYPSNSVTLISDKSLAIRAFDAKEPNNTNDDRKNYGNNRYSVSNIRQWLNSDAEAGQWYLAQHSADAPPNSDNVSQSINPYDTKAGFLNGFSQQFKNALLETNLTVALNTVTDGGGSEILTDKIFLASNTEVGVTNENSIVEGALLPIFSDDASRISYCTTEAIDDSNSIVDPSNDTTPQAWWLRTPRSSVACNACFVSGAGTLSSAPVYTGTYGVRPLCNLPSSTKVEQDEDGIYKLIFD